MSRRTLPKTRDSISFLYFEHCRIEQDEKSIAIFHSQDRYRIPCASICTLMLEPGTSITHAAIKALAENACEVKWVGADALRFYASGQSSARNTERLFHQARIWVDSLQRLNVARRMYQFRFQEDLAPDLTLQQIRGLEGVRVRTLYSHLSQTTGVEWKGRNYKQENWNDANPINQALEFFRNKKKWQMNLFPASGGWILDTLNP